MPITLPKLDNRTFDDLLEEGLEIVRRQAPQWTNHNDSDPGITLIQLFAYMAEMLIYRLDKVTDRNVEAFLKLLNGRAWQADNTRPLGEQIRATITELRKISRAVTGADFEWLVLDEFGDRGIARAHALARTNLEKETAAAVVIKQADNTMTYYSAPATARQKSGIPLIDSPGDRLYIGTAQSYTGTFRGIRFTFVQPATPAYSLSYRYLNKDGKWIEIDERARQLTDYTEGWTKDGLIAFVIFDDWKEMALPEWQMSDEKRYWIEISAATVPTPPARASGVAIEMDESSHVSVVVIGPETISDSRRKEVLGYLNEHRLLTTRVHVVEPRWRDLRVKAKLNLKRDAKELEVEDEAIRRLEEFFHPIRGGTRGAGWPLGRSVYASEVYDLLDRVPGVSYVTGVSFETGDGAASQEVALDPDELVRFSSHQDKRDVEALSPLRDKENK